MLWCRLFNQIQVHFSRCLQGCFFISFYQNLMSWLIIWYFGWFLVIFINWGWFDFIAKWGLSAQVQPNWGQFTNSRNRKQSVAKPFYCITVLQKCIETSSGNSSTSMVWTSIWGIGNPSKRDLSNVHQASINPFLNILFLTQGTSLFPAHKDNLYLNLIFPWSTLILSHSVIFWTKAFQWHMSITSIKRRRHLNRAWNWKWILTLVTMMMMRLL